MGRLLLSSGQVSVILSALIGMTKLSNMPSVANSSSLCIHIRALPLRLRPATTIRTQSARSYKTAASQAFTRSHTDSTAYTGREMGATDG